MKTNFKVLIIPDFMIALRIIQKKEPITVTDLHYETRITYSHLHNIKKLFLNKQWIFITPDGLKQPMNLTEEGKKICEIVNQLFTALNITDEDMNTYRRRGKIKKEDVNNKNDRDRHGTQSDEAQNEMSLPSRPQIQDRSGSERQSYNGEGQQQ